MAEYIERNKLLHKIRWASDPEDCVMIAKRMPASDVVPVRHGNWDDSGRYRFENGDLAIRCTGCGCSLREDEFEKFVWNYCPVCGAKMDGGDHT